MYHSMAFFYTSLLYYPQIIHFGCHVEETYGVKHSCKRVFEKLPDDAKSRKYKISNIQQLELQTSF